jgi:hypothetical protein
LFIKSFCYGNILFKGTNKKDSGPHLS